MELDAKLIIGTRPAVIIRRPGDSKARALMQHGMEKVDKFLTAAHPERNLVRETLDC